MDRLHPGPSGSKAGVLISADVPSGALRSRPAAEVGRRSAGRCARVDGWTAGAEVVIARGVSGVVHEHRRTGDRSDQGSAHHPVSAAGGRAVGNGVDQITDVLIGSEYTSWVFVDSSVHHVVDE